MRQWRVKFGQSVKGFWTRHHAEQFARALALNGTACKVSVVWVTR